MKKRHVKAKVQDKPKAAARDLLAKVKQLAKQGLAQKEMAKALGIKTTITLHSRLLSASQIAGKPIPAFRVRGGKSEPQRIEFLEARRRGRGDGQAFGVNVPQEPLTRAGFKVGDTLQVTVRGNAIFLRQQGGGAR